MFTSRFQSKTLKYLLGLSCVMASIGSTPTLADAPSLANTQGSSNNLYHDWGGNTSPNAAKQLKADDHTPSNYPTGPEKLGDQNGMPPGRSGGDTSGNVQTGGPEKCCEQNTKPEKTTPISGAVDGGKTNCTAVTSYGTLTDYQPFLQQMPSASNYKNPEHNQGALGDATAPAGMNYGARGQSNNAPNLPNSQLVGNSAQIAGIAAANAEQFAQKVPDPQGWSHVAKGVQQAQNAQNADNQGNCCKQNCQNSFAAMKLPLINVANENAAIPCASNESFKSEANVIWMVQQMYKGCYIPMAVLFLLPGAVLTQTKSLVSFSMLGTQDDDTSSPFIGIFRSIMAIFLIPATQLTVSWCIDIGNAMTEPIAQRVQVETLMNWVNEQAYSTDPKNNDNTIKKVQASMGKLAGTSAKDTVQERQNDLTVTVQNMFNTINNMMSQGLNILNGFQLVMMCYLFLLGPIAAALYAWPAAIGRDLFKKAFASWLDGVIVLSLWKFWWCIVLLCMVVRLQSGNVDPTSHYEMYYFSAFMGILVMVPFQPFEFRPGEIVSHVLEKAQQGGGGGSGGGAKGSGAGGQNGNAQQASSSGASNSGTAATKTAGQGNPDQSTNTGTAAKGDTNSESTGKGESQTGSNNISVDNAKSDDLSVKMGGDVKPPPPTA